MSDPAPPAWLAQEPEIVALLHAVLDRFDAQPGAARQRAVFLEVEKSLSSLARGDAGADQTWALMRELAATGVCAVRTARRNPYDAEWTRAKVAFPPSSESCSTGISCSRAPMKAASDARISSS